MATFTVVDYSETQIYVTDGWREWFIPKFRTHMVVDEPILEIYWTDTEKGFTGLTRLLPLDFNDVDLGYGFGTPTSARDLELIIEDFINSSLPTLPDISIDNSIARFSGTSGKILQDSNVILDDNDEITGVEEITIKTLPVFESAANIYSTGIWFGGILSVNVDTTKFDISAGKGQFIDNFTDVNNPTITDVTWSAFTAVVPTFIASVNLSFVAINSSGALLQQNTPYTNEQRRSVIVIGTLFHPNNVNIFNVNDESHESSGGYLANDLVNALGDINISGNNFNPSSNTLEPRKEAGTSFRVNSNRENNVKDPNTLTSGVIDPVTFIYAYNDGSGGITTILSSTLVDPNQYDDGSGTLQPVPNNRWTNQWCYFFVGSGVVIIRYGETIYSNKANAEEAALVTVPVTIGTGLDIELIRTVISLKKGNTDLSDTGEAVFTHTGKFGLTGGVGGGAGGTFQDLQDTYNNSTDPEITTDSTRGALSVMRGSSADTDDIFEGKNGAGTQVFGVTGEGKVTADIVIADSNTADRIASIGSSKEIESLDTTTYPSLTELAYVKGVTSSIQVQIDAAGGGTNTESIHIAANSTNYIDSIDYYFGRVRNTAVGVGSSTFISMYFDVAGTITAANIEWASFGNIGTNESFSMYIRLNNTTDYLIATVAAATRIRRFVNIAMSVPIVANDYIWIKTPTPAWATNPTGTRATGDLTFTPT